MLTEANRAFKDSFNRGHQCTLCPSTTIDQTLPEKERVRQAEATYSLHMTRVSLRAAAARRRARIASSVADKAEAELRDLQRDDNAV